MVNNPVLNVATRTVMTGVQTVSTSLATNLVTGNINNMNWNSIATSAAISMAGTLTTSSLGAINSGVDGNRVAAFNSGQRADIGNLNSLAGSLASQGVSYALVAILR